MALLNPGWLFAGLAAASVGVAPGCSVLYDADSLEATRRDASGDGVAPVDARDASDGVEPPDDGDDGVDAVPDAVLDAISDAVSDVAPEVVPDTTPVDLVDIDGDTGPDDTETPPDAVEVELVVRHTGEAGCTLDYYLQAITGCPKSCNWDFRIDATGSTGVSNVAWRFSVTGGYSLSPSSGQGMTEDVSVLMPSCSLFGSESVGPASLLVEAAVDGRPMQLVDKIDFAVRLVASCPSTPRADCLDPR